MKFPTDNQQMEIVQKLLEKVRAGELAAVWPPGRTGVYIREGGCLEDRTFLSWKQAQARVYSKPAIYIVPIRRRAPKTLVRRRA